MKLKLKIERLVEIFRGLSAAKMIETPASVQFGILVGMNWDIARAALQVADRKKQELLNLCARTDPETGQPVRNPENGEIFLKDAQAWVDGLKDIESTIVEVDFQDIPRVLVPEPLPTVVASTIYHLFSLSAHGEQTEEGSAKS